MRPDEDIRPDPATHPESGTTDLSREEAGQIKQAVAELCGAQKILRMYPAGHDHARQSAERVFTSLTGLLQTRSGLSLGLHKGKLVVDQGALALDGPAFDELRVSLRNHHIVLVRFLQGLSRDELSVFLQLLSADPEGAAGEPEIGKAAHEAGIRHIHIQVTDFASLRHVDEEAIRKGEAEDEPPAEQDSVWLDFVSHLNGSDPRSGDPAGATGPGANRSPEEVASLLNYGVLNLQQALEGYESAIQRYLGTLSADAAEFMLDEDAEGTGFNALLEGLNPALRSQFLRATLARCDEQAHNPRVKVLLNGFTRGHGREMLQQASADDSEISPTLLHLIRRLVGLEGSHSGREDGEGPSFLSGAASTEETQAILRRESYERYVDPEYDAVLEELSSRSSQRHEARQETFDLDALTREISSPHVEARIAEGLIRLMGAEEDVDEYKEYARRLFSLMDILLEEGEFSIPAATVRLFERHSQEKARPETRSVAEGYLNAFRTSTFVFRSLSAFQKWRQTREEAALDLFTAVGPEVVPPVLHLYLKTQEREERHRLLALLNAFPARAAGEALASLRKIHGPTRARLIALLGEVGGSELAEDLEPLLEDPDPIIRVEALEALVKLGAPRSVEHLIGFFRRRNAEEFARALEIAGRYRVRDAAPTLASQVKVFSFFKSTYERNAQIVEALGRLGDPASIPILERLARARWSPHARSLSRVKRILFRSLDGYESTALTTLLRIGSGSPDPRIRKACRELQQQGARATRREPSPPGEASGDMP